MGNTRSYDGREIGDRSRRWAQPVHTSENRIADGARQSRKLGFPAEPDSLALVQRAGFDERLENLFREEWVAARP